MSRYIAHRVARASNPAGGHTEVDLETGQRARAYGPKDEPPGQYQEYASDVAAVSAAKLLVLKYAGQADVLVFKRCPDPHLPNHTVDRFVGYAIWSKGCARGVTA
jgi:hypothetical protein